MTSRFNPPPEPTDAAGFNDMGNRYSRNGVYDQAIENYTRAIELDGTFAFGAWYGFLCCVAMVLVARAMGWWLKRPESYYDNEDPTKQAPVDTPGAGQTGDRDV